MDQNSLELRLLTVGEWQENCYLLVDPATEEGVLVDPGGEWDRLRPWMAGVVVRRILLTHAHIDHLGAVAQARAVYEAPAWLHPADWPLARQKGVEPDFELLHGDRFLLGSHAIEAFHTPGHTPGSACLLAGTRALVGDAIFPGGPGHTSTPEELRQSLASLERSIFTWPDETELLPGHGPATTVGRERPGFEAFLRYLYRARPLPPDLFGDVTWEKR